MAEDSLQRASFVRTDETGLLEFRVDDGRLICVEVTDELERGIIESKQIVAELKGTPSPHSEKALPISTIRPRHITPMRSEMYLTIDRSWAMNR